MHVLISLTRAITSGVARVLPTSKTQHEENEGKYEKITENEEN